ncbi:MAG TPA: glycine oxidase ThiO [Gemmatimonadota bacterium]|nr:glycine oxidase ThiO [Gemmatimonadota bacterium]
MDGGSSADVVVVGGGLVGCLAARELAREGFRVRVVERGPELGREASTAAAGMLSPQMEAAEDLLVEAPEASSGRAMLELCLAARNGWPSFAGKLESETGRDVHLRSEGTLVVALTPVEAGRLERSAGAQKARGLRAELLDPAEARRLEPAVRPGIAAALLLPDDQQVDPVPLMEAVAVAVRSTPGIEVTTGTGARALLSEAGRVTGIETGTGPLSAPRVVLAAGAWSGRLAGLPRALPVRPVKGQMAAVLPDRLLIRRVVGGRGAYCVPRDDGRIVIGATVEERGYDARVSRVEVDALIAAAGDVVAGLAEAPVVERWAGLRPGTPDSLPVVGADPELEGLLYATGHYRNGILLAPLTAACLAALAAGRRPPVDLTAFAPDRPALTPWMEPSTGR